MKIKKCDGFGTKYDRTDELCQLCNYATECFIETNKDELNTKWGIKPKVLEPREVKNPIMIQFIGSSSGNIEFRLIFNKEWLKKQLEKR